MKRYTPQTKEDKVLKCKNCSDELSGYLDDEFIEISNELSMCYDCIFEILVAEERSH